MGGKKRAKNPAAGGNDTKRGSGKKTSSSTSNNSRGTRRSLRVKKDNGGRSEVDSDKKDNSQENNESDGANNHDNTTKQHHDSEPMDIDEQNKPSDEQQANGSSNVATKKHHHKHHHHHHEPQLSEQTLKRIKDYLLSDKMNENLDEDAIAVKILRTDRATSERVRFLHNPYADSDEEEDTPDQSYHAAEEYTLALEFYKRIVAETQAERPNSPLDKKTLYWLRKALGLNRRNDLWDTTAHEQQQEEADDSDGEDEERSQGKKSKPRRLVTRGMVRSTRIKRRAERQTKESMNLNALVSAVDDLENEFGVFKESSTQGGKKRKRQKEVDRDKDSLDEESSKVPRTKEKTARGSKPKAKPKESVSRTLIAHIPEQNMKEKSKIRRAVKRPSKAEAVKVRVKVDGKYVSDKSTSREKDAVSASKRSPSRGTGHSKKAESRKRRKEVSEAHSRKKGHILLPVDPSRAMALDLHDYIEESSHVSLGLLEWKRRQERDADSKESTVPVPESGFLPIPERLAKTGVTAELPSWDIANPIPVAQRQPATTEPARYRHSDEKYAGWINSMINILNGSGRSWALHEFFYSDIDRAWFNFDQFRVEVAKLGVPPTARLTRKEWSVVRRSLPKRPRRFSRRFIQSELAKLCQYRDIVRAIQHSETVLPDFGFDVPAYIKVGATVTAIHWKRRVLHRGTVLAHDPRRSGYWVQFERPELGSQFCPDYEVASHGIPEILFQASATSLEEANLGAFSDRHSQIGDLSYGTSYGPMFVDQVDPATKDKAEKIALLEPVGTRGGTNGSSSVLNRKETLVERVAERETFVELIGTIDAALMRKNMLLDAIEKCNSDIASMIEDDGPESAKFQQDSPFMAHYTWLQANLRTTNEALESSLVLLQTMYGRLYSGTGTDDEEMEKAKAEEVESQLQRLCQDDTVNDELVAPWSHAMTTAVDNVGSLVARTTSGNKKHDAMSDEEKLRMDYLEPSFAAACRLLLNANYCSALVRSERADLGSGKGLTLSVSPMNASLEQQVRALDQRTSMPKNTGMGEQENIAHFNKADAMRKSALKELQEAVRAYETELAATHVAKKIIRS